MKFGIQATDKEQGKTSAIDIEFDAFQNESKLKDFIGEWVYNLMQEIHGAERISKAPQTARQEYDAQGWDKVGKTDQSHS